MVEVYQEGTINRQPDGGDEHLRGKREVEDLHHRILLVLNFSFQFHVWYQLVSVRVLEV